MCRWIAYSGAPVFVDSVVFNRRNSLIEQSRYARRSKSAINADGFGIGWYGKRKTPGIFKDIRPAWNDQNLKSISEQILSPLFFAHVRASTGTSVSRVNCHPFRYKHWMFMHNGKIGGYEAVRQALLGGLGADTFAALQGTTDSELMLMMAVDAGLEDDPATAVARMFAKTVHAQSATGVATPLTMTIALSDGARTFAVRFASSGEPPSLYYSTTQDAVMIVSEPLDDKIENWANVAPSHMLIAECDDVTVYPFTPSL